MSFWITELPLPNILTKSFWKWHVYQYRILVQVNAEMLADKNEPAIKQLVENGPVYDVTITKLFKGAGVVKLDTNRER